MTVTTRIVDAPVQDAWAVIADPQGYAYWVVGAAAVRAVEGDWPQPGSTFHHTQGRFPVRVRDSTTVLECDEGRRVLLEVRARPWVVGRVEITLSPTSDGGTEIRIDERIVGGVFGLLGPLNAPAIALRNEEAIRRLTAMAWTRSRMGTPA